MSRRVKEMLKENNELQEQLSDDGKKVLTDIVVYLCMNRNGSGETLRRCS